MILPTKRLTPERAMITIGADLLSLLTEPKTVSRLWSELSNIMSQYSSTRLISYDWFILTLDLLYILGSIEMDHGRIRRTNR
jgi:hypothetical protein